MAEEKNEKQENSESKQHGNVGNDNAKKWDFETAKTLFENIIEWMKSDDNNFLEIDYLAQNKHGKNTLKYLIKEYDNSDEELATLHEVIKTIQEARIQKLGFAEKINTTMAIFILKNNHGYKDRFEGKIDGDFKGEVNVKHGIPDAQLAALGEAFVQAAVSNSRK